MIYAFQESKGNEILFFTLNQEHFLLLLYYWSKIITKSTLCHLLRTTEAEFEDFTFVETGVGVEVRHRPRNPCRKTQGRSHCWGLKLRSPSESPLGSWASLELGLKPGCTAPVEGSPHHSWIHLTFSLTCFLVYLSSSTFPSLFFSLTHTRENNSSLEISRQETYKWITMIHWGGMEYGYL